MITVGILLSELVCMLCQLALEAILMGLVWYSFYLLVIFLILTVTTVIITIGYCWLRNRQRYNINGELCFSWLCWQSLGLPLKSIVKQWTSRTGCRLWLPFLVCLPCQTLDYTANTVTLWRFCLTTEFPTTMECILHYYWLCIIIIAFVSYVILHAFAYCFMGRLLKLFFWCAYAALLQVAKKKFQALNIYRSHWDSEQLCILSPTTSHSLP